MMVALCCLVGISSCSETKENTPATPAAKNIEGLYYGDIDCSVMGQVSTFEEGAFQIAATDEATVTVTLPSFGEGTMLLPSIPITGVKVYEADGVTTLKQTQTTGQTTEGKNYTCTLTGTITGKKLSIKFTLVYGAMPMPMICSSEALKR